MINLGPKPAAKVRSDYAFSNEVDIGSREENALNQNPRALLLMKSKAKLLAGAVRSLILFV